MLPAAPARGLQPPGRFCLEDKEVEVLKVFVCFRCIRGVLDKYGTDGSYGREELPSYGTAPPWFSVVWGGSDSPRSSCV